MSETDIENDRAYRTEQKVEGGVHLLVWLAIYGVAVIVVVMDIFFWRT